ncbi:hypothetical protein A3860_23515 [Niastella vici]|uniref:CBU-0592-like domain-containing protein n=1 Tax=Niastella vici TaxID=1703345 RepID=A0A1V9FZY9_9BACT|nr:hypothetical protein [Niastella vici]OQP63902.1 hypothetical protein A3860_23515 [Niastella vici]
MLLDFIGWIGFASCVIAYFLLNIGYIRFNGWPFQLLNLLGGTGLAIKAYQLHDVPNMLANGLWGLIAVGGIIKYFIKRSDQEIPSKL